MEEGIYGTWVPTQRVVKIEDAEREYRIAIIQDERGREFVTRYENLRNVFEIDAAGNKKIHGDPARK